MRQLSISELDSICQLAVIDIPDRYPVLKSYAELQLNTGLRASEILEKERWGEQNPETYIVQCAKAAATRLIPKSEVPQILQYPYDLQSPIFDLDYKTYHYMIKSYLPKLHTAIGTNTITSHIFRYRFTKLLDLSGKTVPEIQSIMGHENEASTLRYITMPIWIDD